MLWQSAMPPLPQIQQMLARAVAAHRAGNLAQAEFLYRAVLQADSRQFDALHMLGVIEGQRGNFAAGIEHLNRALRIRPEATDVLVNLGRMQGELGNYSDAEATYKRALALDPRSVLAQNGLSIVLRRQGRYDQALTHSDGALKLAPNYADAWSNRGNALFDLHRFDDALADYDKAIALQRNHAQAHLGRGNALSALMRYEAALAAYDRALALKPAYEECFFGRGNVYFKLARFGEALAAYDSALAIKPDYADCYIGQGDALNKLKRHEEAYAAYAMAFSLKPDLPYAEGSRLNTKLSLCRWDDIDAECTHLIDAVRAGERRSTPFVLLALPATLADQLKCAQLWFSDRCPDPRPRPLWRGEQYQHERIRVAYLSPDFRDHPVALLTAGMFESHDRSRFEIIGVPVGPPSDDWMRTRLRGAFDRFLDVGTQADKEIAQILREAEIDIAVDLSGITENSRPAIFAQRPAPVQISYLGYCGTMGAAFYDYLLADRTAISQQDFEFFSEKVVWLPDSFMVNDRTRRIGERTPTRAELDLPENGFVFCCFNQPYKINPTMFGAWMRLLLAVDGSVLWLRDHNAIATHNLRLEAARRGVAPERLVFAASVPNDADYLARQRQADLMLDTLNYNAHTTACDALWAGVPILTCMGSTFAGRVAAGLLRAVGLPELVTQSLADYEALALKLAREPSLLGSLRVRLARNRATCPLFDTARFTRNIESAYTTIWERTRRGESPQSFAVEAPVS
jgi:predicted O-linked N-acetylglucosamine transferase (SPINDLY family)